MDLEWCAEQKRGFELIEPNENLCQAYLLKAEDALATLITTRSRDWRLTIAYYAIYHALYSLLMRVGVKCEIHACTIAFAKTYLRSHLERNHRALLDIAFTARKDAQYYVDRSIKDEDYERIMRQAPAFVVACKDVIITQDEIADIRNLVAHLKFDFLKT